MRKILNSAIALLILVASSGFSVNMHFCHDTLVDTALNKPAKSCCEVSSGDQPCTGSCDIQRKCPCENRHIAIDTDDFLTTSFDFHFENSPQLPVPWLTDYTLFHTELSGELHSLPPDFRKPPPVAGVTLPEIQSFLL